VKSQGLGVSEAIISKIQSLRGGGLRLTLDLPESADAELVAKLMQIAMGAQPNVAVGFGEVENA